MSSIATENDKWDIDIKASHGLFDINFREIWRYRDLLVMFVRKDVVTRYKQTIFGPLWFMLQPVLTALVFTIIFGRIAKVPTNGAPPLLFYLGSLTLWSYFSETFGVVSKTFSENAAVLGKVYFPRLVLPFAKAIAGIMKMGMQLAIFGVVLAYHTFVTHKAEPNWYALLLPLILLLLTLYCLGAGLLIAALTSKYRDLSFVVVFGIQLYMYVTPVIYPISIRSAESQTILWLNPLASLFEAFKYGFIGQRSGTLNFFWLGYSAVFCFIIFVVGIIMFNRVEKKFVDTI